MKKLKVFFSVLSLVSASTAFSADGCGKFNHARSYWVDEDGTPHFRTYAFSDDCKNVKVDLWHGESQLNKSYADKVDGVFNCLKRSGNLCLFGYSWSATDEGTIISVTESISKVMDGKRLVKQTISRSINTDNKGMLKELLVADVYYKDQGEDDWFNAKTTRSRCNLTATPNCHWNNDIMR